MSKRRRSKQRRAYLKKWSSDYIKTDRFDHSKIISYEIFQNRNRIRTHTGPPNNREPIADNNFMETVIFRCACGGLSMRPFFCKKCETRGYPVARSDKIPKTKARPATYMNDEGAIVGIESTPREEALKRRQSIMQSERLQKVEEYTRVSVLYKFGVDSMELYRNGTNHFFEKKHGDIIQRSCIYRSQERAMTAYQRDKILWMETLRLKQPN